MKRKHHLICTAIASVAGLLVSAGAQACDSQPYIGSICVAAFNFCPQGYAQANGAILPINQNQALFSLLGTTYGGNGVTTFALPDLRGRVPVGVGQGPGLGDVQLGEVWGQEQVTLTTANLPSHTHTASTTASTPTVKVAVSTNTANNQIAPSGTYTYLAGSSSGPGAAAIWSDKADATVDLGGVTATTSGITVQSVGSGQPVPTQPPSLGVMYCIALQGYFPSRP